MKRLACWFLGLCVLVAVVYGAGRLYYRVTGGFTIGNITSNLPYDPRWETRAPSAEEQKEIDGVLSQKFFYLGKGCQSYVFQSEDKQYVLKFFKYQRFRPQQWINFFTFIPRVNSYQLAKIADKRKKLDILFHSWKIAFEELQQASGLLYIHLNKTDHLRREITLVDKIGLSHRLDLDHYEFLIQRKVEPLCSYINQLMKNQETVKAQDLIEEILDTFMSEYARGIADADHALMQNTGVLNAHPIHIDVGQFVRSEKVKKPEVYKLKIFSKMFRFNYWLKKEYPILSQFLETKLQEIIGPQISEMKPVLKTHDEGLDLLY